jgi:hypothetical protein
MKYIKQICAILAFSVVGFAQEAPDQSLNNGTPIFTAKATIKIVAEDGLPIEGAKVHVAVWNHSQYKDRNNDFIGQSDNEGLFVVESNCQGNFEVTVTKNGYYGSNYHHQPCDWSTMPKDGDKLQPWNPTVPIILKKIGKPIPMIVRLGWASSDHIHYAPKLNHEVGFDLMKSDWVKPDGTGEIADILVSFKSDFQDRENYKTEATLRFSNPANGLIPINQLIGSESVLEYPRFAPANGYGVNSINLMDRTGVPDPSAPQEPVGYFLRIRTVIEKETGKVISAQYGKIVSPREIGSNTNPFKLVSFMYKNRKLDTTPGLWYSSYINPTPNDRNLEYDQQNNLATEADKGVTLAP